ncbi:MAG: hypothetical protein MUF54_23220, partial [Polyangiaceae bacterium]|nr:hypothetical protein [Polyangiaceae bacterium]
MNQPRGGFPPDDGYGGVGSKGATIPGGPPADVSAIAGPAATAPADGPAPTVVDRPVSPAAAAYAPRAAQAPARPGFRVGRVEPFLSPGPIGYAPRVPLRRKSGGGLGTFFGVTFVLLLVGGGAAGAVWYARRAAGASEDSASEQAPLGTFAPAATIEPEGVAAGDPPPAPTQAPAPEVMGDPSATTATPPPATTEAKPPTTRKPPATAASTTPG